MRILVTGGAGFIGSNLVHKLCELFPKSQIVVFDLLTYAGNPENLLPVRDKIKFVKGDVANLEDVEKVFDEFGPFDWVFHLAAESHVDRSIYGPQQFVRTNVFGTYVILEVARKRGVGVFIHVSTDEVYGSTKKGYFRESSPLKPSSPYSASKASGDLIAQSYAKTFKLPVIVTRPSNNYGPYQYPEKFIPLCITNALEDKPIPIYGTGENVRDWLYVEDCATAHILVAEKGKVGQVYNIGAGQEMKNIDVAKKILDILGKPHSLITFVKDRPAHDFRYAMRFDKIKKHTGWEPKVKFDEGIRKTIEWYQKNKHIWEKIKRSPEFEEHKKKIYGELF